MVNTKHRSKYAGKPWVFNFERKVPQSGFFTWPDYLANLALVGLPFFSPIVGGIFAHTPERNSMPQATHRGSITAAEQKAVFESGVPVPEFIPFTNHWYFRQSLWKSTIINDLNVDLYLKRLKAKVVIDKNCYWGS